MLLEKAKQATRINLALNMQQTYIPRPFHKPQPHLYLINYGFFVCGVQQTPNFFFSYVSVCVCFKLKLSTHSLIRSYF